MYQYAQHLHIREWSAFRVDFVSLILDIVINSISRSINSDIFNWELMYGIFPIDV